ncbi:hypothetical protein GALMADRAFT_134664 [Galerina marginata CBS 339.88]|uniref:Uncharacterized protein n=1 Tax=Galerina marginata (strain CBS 339.88) TaxID=685588 RepID=A0A067TLE6_GALM3|nr:hypothetical protein GALMADRAFT_134664 [Galerina marginata CBS 339.88]
MATKSFTHIFLPVFGGQGTLAFDPGNDFHRFSNLTSSPSASVILSACHTAFHDEVASLDTKDQDKLGICLSQFKHKESILKPQNEQQFNNPVFAGPILLLFQLLRYLSFIENAPITTDSTTPFTDALRCNTDHGVGILGFSSGIISACVVATSPSALSFISHAVEAYRLALWIGIRSQFYRAGLQQSSALPIDYRPWALVIVGIKKVNLKHAIDDFNQSFDIDLVHLTAVIGDGRVTVSGRPDHLASFVQTLPDGVTVHETGIRALYHSLSQLQAVRAEVSADIASRDIRFPTFLDMVTPIRSTFSGDLISDSDRSGSLVDLIIDMVLTQPVNWDLVIDHTTISLPLGVPVSLVNIGLGTGLIRGLTKTISLRCNGDIQTVDLCDDAVSFTPKVKQEPIAIIGMAVDMPGAPNVGSLWELLMNGSNTVEEIPKERFLLAEYPDNRRPGRSMKAHTGNFVHDIDEFDYKFFNISPREAKNMDPQQRILLRIGYEALEDAGYVPHSSPTFQPVTFGCFIGAATHDYVQNLRNDIDVYYSTGTLKAFLSGRLSYCLGLSGPSLVVDTACSSSMVAIHQACRALMNRDCHAALAGGVNVMSSPDMFMGLDRGHFLSPSGQSKPFDASADGYCRGEGCGIFVLKRLSDAMAENDRILGIIRGIEVNQSGEATSITHPHPPSQQALFKQLLMHSDIEPNSVNVVEAHGTGTQAGDTNEVESIRRVLAADRAPNNPLYVTSIKANIGHLEAASGCASLAKVLLMFRHQIIPRQILLQTLNPRIVPLASDNTVISTENVTWMSAKGENPRIALINNFGAAGSNAALLVEEHIPQELISLPNKGASYVFGLSAKDRPSLDALRSKYMTWLRDSSNQGTSPLDIAYTATARRQIYPYRLAISHESIEQLVDKLEAAPIVNVTEHDTGTVFVFSGQGHHYRGMGVSLYATSTIFRNHIDECDFILTSHGFSGVRSVINGDNPSSPAMNNIELQSATFSLQYALAKLWISWGIQPVAVVGHSLGEYAALVIADILSLKDGLLIVATRARLMFERCPPMTTGMVAVSLGPVKLQPILESNRRFSNISISCFNSPNDCVVSGPLKELDELKLYLEDEQIKSTQLRVPYGYHSPSMFPLAEDLVTLAGKVGTRPTRIPFISTVLGRVILPGDRSFPSQDYIARQCVEPVRFTEGIGSYLSNPLFSGTTTWLEISSHPSVLPMLRSFPALSDSPLLASLRTREESWTTLSKTLALFYLGNYTIDWRRVFIEIGPAICIELPSYAFSQQKFWVPYVEEPPKQLDSQQPTKFTFLKTCVRFPNNRDNVAEFQTPISQLKYYIKGHRVGGVPLCPASVYLELVSGAITLAMEYMLRDDVGYDVVLRQIDLSNPLTWNYGDDIGSTTVTITVDASNESFTVKSRLSLHEAEIIHASGGYHLRSQFDTRKDFNCLLPSVIRSIDAILKPGNFQALETFSTRTTYQVIFPRVVEYSTAFHTLQSISMLSGGLEATGTITLSSDCDAGAFFVHPLFYDTLIHIAGFISNLRGGQNDAYICNEIGSVQILPTSIKTGAPFTIYCKILSLNEESGILGESFAILDTQPRILIARVTGIRFQRVRLSSLKTGLASIAGILSPISHTVREGSSNSSLPSNVMVTVVRIVAEACKTDVEDVSVRQDLDCLGIDSLMRIELAYDISRAIPGFGCRPQELGICKNIVDIVDMILSVVDPAPSGGKFDDNSPVSPSTTFSTPRTLVQSTTGSPCMRRIVARILDIEEDVIKDDTQLATLGLDSLSSIEAIHTLRQEYQLNVPGNLLVGARTIRELESQILKLEPSYFPFTVGEQGSFNQGPSSSFVKTCQGLHNRTLSLLQNSASGQTPLVLIHDGSGLIVSYERMATLNRRVWAIGNPRFASSEPWSSIVQMAQAYANFILDEMEGPVILGGWSFGGVVAFEVANYLAARSMVVKGVVIIDSPSPLQHVPLSPSLIEQVLDVAGKVEPDFRQLSKAQFTINSRLLSDYSPDKVATRHAPSIVFLMCDEPYSPPNEDDVPSWLSDRSDATAIFGGWEAFTGSPVKLFKIPGHHFQPFEPQNVLVVSACIAEACCILDNVDDH